MPKPREELDKKVSKARAEEDTRTRAKKIIDNGGTPQFPPLDDSEYLLGYMQDLDWIESSTAGRAPLTSDEILRWADGEGIELRPWEFGTLRAMSRAYLSQSFISEQPDCPPPYGNPVNEFDRDVVAKKVASLFGARVTTKKADT